MKIGVVGLRPRQISDLMSRKFIASVDCMELAAGTRSKRALIRFGQENDRIVMMEKSVPTWALKLVPAGKRILVGGGISSVVHCIEGLDATGDKGAQVIVAPVSDTVPVYTPPAMPTADDVPPPVKVAVESPAPIEKPPAEKEPVDKLTALAETQIRTRISLAKDVPIGKESQYSLPKSDILINYPNSSGVQNYTILLAAEAGDIVRFARPEGLSLPKWRNRIAVMRSGYWGQKGILLEAHFFEEYVDILVMDQNAPVVPKNTIAAKIVEEPANASRDMGSTTLVTDGMGIPANVAGLSPRELLGEGMAHQMSVDAHVQATPANYVGMAGLDDTDAAAPEAPLEIKHPDDEPPTNVDELLDAVTVEAATETGEATPDVEMRVHHTEDEKSFWREVYLIKLRQGNDDPEGHAERALRLYMERFKA